MTKRRRLIVAALTVFVLAGVLFGMRSTTWHSQLRNSANQPTGNVAFSCGPLFGSGYVRGPATTIGPVIGTPCGTRSQDQIMVGLDILLGLAGIVLVVRFGRQKSVPFTANL